MEINQENQKTLDLIAQAIFDKKGMNILAIDVRGISTLTDFYILAEGSVERHVKAIAKEVQDRMEKEGQKLWHKESDQEGAWIVLDFTDMVVHILTTEFREKYALEEVWREGRIVNLHFRIAEQIG